MKNHYIYQGFLLDCPYKELPPDDITAPLVQGTLDYSCGYDLFDYLAGECRRTISLSELDTTVDTVNDFQNLLRKMEHVDILYVIVDRPVADNKLIVQYHTATLLAFVWHFRRAGIACHIAQLVQCRESAL